jgi:hypothetical protein
LHSALLTEIFDVIDRQYTVQHYESMTLQSRLVKRYRAQIAEANQLRVQEVLLIQQELEERTAEMLAIQQSLEEKLASVNHSLNRRTGRSAAYGIHLPPSPVHSPQRKLETRIPRFQPKSFSTQATERRRTARETARKELNSVASCGPFTSSIPACEESFKAKGASVEISNKRSVHIQQDTHTPTSVSSSSKVSLFREDSVAISIQTQDVQDIRTESNTDDATEASTEQGQNQTWPDVIAYGGEDAEMSA